MYELLIIYQIKHFVCDYPLQGKYMLGKFKKWPDFIKPLAAHAAVHGVATFLIALAWNAKIAFWVAALDAVVHFAVDRIKASPNLLGRFTAISKREYVARMTMIESFQAVPENERHPEIQRALNNALEDHYYAMRSNTFFWWSLGADQMAHHLTHYLIIYLLLSN